MASATSPFPVPGSPSISTVARVVATWRACSITRASARECPTRRSNPRPSRAARGDRFRLREDPPI
jgi:hypothetical protein